MLIRAEIDERRDERHVWAIGHHRVFQFGSWRNGALSRPQRCLQNRPQQAMARSFVICEPSKRLRNPIASALPKNGRTAYAGWTKRR